MSTLEIEQSHGLTAGPTMLKRGDPGYDEARTVWNAMVDRHPRIIARCANAGEVVTAIRAARDLGLEIGVRCGGHSVLGLPPRCCAAGASWPSTRRGRPRSPRLSATGA